MISIRRKSAVAVGAGLTALSLVAAEAAPATPPAGSASSSMSAVTLTVRGIEGAPGTLTVLEAGTLATTDANDPGNLLDGPWALATVAPLILDGQPQGAASARSDQSGSATSPLTSLAGVDFAPIDITAKATDSLAQAVIGASSGKLEVIPGLVSVGITSLGVDSLVNGDQASNTQGLVVDGLDVKLGDLVPADLLAALPIDVLLDLLAQLPVSAPDLAGVTDAATRLVADVRTGVDGVTATAARIESVTASLTKAVTDLADQKKVVDGLQVDLGAAQTAATNAAANVTAATALLQSHVDGLSPEALLCLANPLTATSCLEQLQATAGAALATAQAASQAATGTVSQLTADLAKATSLLDGLAKTVDELTKLVDDLVKQLTSLLDALLADLQSLVGALTNLNGSLGDVVAGLLDTTMVGVDGVEIAMKAVATGDTATSAAGTVCELGDITIAGVALGGGECDGSTLTGSLTSALGTVRGVLQSLPVLDAVAVPEVTLDLLKMSSSVTEDAGTVTSSASVVPLVVDLPSVDVDPSALVAGLLDQLQGDLLGKLLASLPASGTLDGLGLGGAAGQLQAINDTLKPALATAGAAVGDVVALLPDGSGLTAFTTPGFTLEIDPSSTASFRPGGDGSSTPAPSPAPLPVTGGGALVLGVTGLAGAWALRRRR